MSSGDAFNQVKALLGKLDRSIDEARARRTGSNEDDVRGPDGSSRSDQRGEYRHDPRLDGRGESRTDPRNDTRAESRPDQRDTNGDQRPGHREIGGPARPAGTHPSQASGASPDTAPRREASTQPIGASPTNSNPTRRPGIGRARPLNRQGDTPADPKRAQPSRSVVDDTDDTWVGGKGSKD